MAVSTRCGVRQSLGFVGALIVSFAMTGDLRATVTVNTSDGREISGAVDDRTTERHLWLRHEDQRMVLSTPIAWSSIIAATIDGQTVEVSELVEMWPQLKSSAPAGFLSRPVVSNVAAKNLPEPRRFSRRPLVQCAAADAGRIRAIEIDAFLVNLDRDVEPDGFELRIGAIDDRGQRVAVRGNIYARLVGERDEEHSGAIRFEDLQRWSQPVRQNDFFEEGVARYALRFRTVRPEFDLELIPFAMLNVRLGVYGQGNFEASIPVMIRKFNPFRDQLQKFELSRFWQGELSEKVRHRAIAPVGDGVQAWSR